MIWLVLAGMAAAGGPALTVEGSCPGRVEIAAGPFAPEVDVMVFGAMAEGDTLLPGGPCAGTDVGLDRPRLLRRGRTARDGFYRFAPTLDGPACEAFIEVVEAPSCASTGAEPIHSEPGFDGIYTAVGRAGPSSAHLYFWFEPSIDHVDPDTGLQAPIGDPGLFLTALAFSPDGALYGAEAAGEGAARIVRVNLDGTSDVVLEPGIAGGLPGFSIGPDGLAYGWYKREGRFVTMDLDAGTVVSDIPAAAPGDAMCMAHAADGTLYAMSLSSLYIVDPLAPEAPEYVGEVDWRIGAFGGVGCTFHDGSLYALRMGTDLYTIDVATLVATDTGTLVDRSVDAIASPTP